MLGHAQARSSADQCDIKPTQRVLHGVTHDYKAHWASVSMTPDSPLLDLDDDCTDWLKLVSHSDFIDIDTSPPHRLYTSFLEYEFAQNYRHLYQLGAENGI